MTDFMTEAEMETPAAPATNAGGDETNIRGHICEK